MARIGEMPSTDDISAGGFIIYTKDGVHANKITVEDFANALNILMTQEVDTSGGGAGGGLKYWQEYQDSAGNSFLIAQDPTTVLAYPTEGIVGLNRDNWTSLYQYDNWQSQEPIPNLPGVIELKTISSGETTYNPYILFALLHPIGTQLSDFTHVEDDIYKILSEDIGKYKVTLFCLAPEWGSNNIFVWNDNPDYENNTSRDWSNYISNLGGFGTIVKDYVGEIFDSTEDAQDFIDSVFLSSGTGMGVSIAGYYKSNQVIDNLVEYAKSDTNYGDEATYTYIQGTFDNYKVSYSDDGLDYTDYPYTLDPPNDTIAESWANLFLDILHVTKVGDYAAISNQGIFFGIPFNREQYNSVEGHLDIENATAKYTPYEIHLKGITTHGGNSDLIFIDPNSSITNDGVYKEYVARYVEQQIGSIEYITKFLINSLSIVDDDQHVEIFTGQGIYFDRSSKTLSVNTSQLQGALIPGEGVEIENNTISFEGKISDVQVDFNSVVDENGYANIILPSGMIETQLQDGNHTEVETVSSGQGYTIKRINIVDLRNETSEVADDAEFGDISTGEYVDNTSQVVVSMTIPAHTKGMLYGHAIINNNLVDADGYFGSMIVSTSSSWPENDSDAFYSPMFDSKAIIKPYQESGVNVYTQTVMKTAGFISNDTDSAQIYRLLVKIHANKATSVYGKLTYVQNINV